MKTEFKDISNRVGKKVSEIAWGMRTWLVVAPYLPLVPAHGIYAGIRGRFDEVFRENYILEMQTSAYCSKIDESKSIAVRLWSRRQRQDARQQIQEALDWSRQRDDAFDAMSDREMRAYAMGGALAVTQHLDQEVNYV